MLMGIAVRTGSPLSLNMAEPMWKLLAGSQLTLNDIAEVMLILRLPNPCFSINPHTNLYRLTVITYPD